MHKDAEKPKSSEMTFWEHTEELAKRLKSVIYSFVAATIIAMVFPADLSFFSDPFNSFKPLVGVVLKKIREQILPPNVVLIGLGLTDPLELYALASIVFGFTVAAPVFAYQIYKFVDPALYPHERSDVYPFIASFTGLFIFGLIFGYLLITPYIISMMMVFFPAVGAELFISVNDFYFNVFITTFLTGAIFTFPVFLVLLVKYGIIQTSLLTRNRKYVYAGLLILVMIITPGEGGIANFLLYVPLIILLESGIYVARRYEKQGKVIHRRASTDERKCKFCEKPISKSTPFCTNCGKSQE
jgi:sec-independent protein translocase protein TatC